MKDKLRDCFSGMVVYKNLKKNNFFTALSLPSFMRDWLLAEFQNEDGDFDVTQISDFVKMYIPRKEDWTAIKDRIIFERNKVQILAKITVDIDIQTSEITFALPDFGLMNKDTIIEEDVWEQVKDELIAEHETWGMLELGYRSPNGYEHQFEEDKVKRGKKGKIKLTAFKNFCPYTIDLEYYKDVRNEFDIDEWIDILLGAIDYNASGYKTKEQKLAMLSRLLPFVEKRLNIIELAPKGTGKSYVFGHISKYGLLTDGGKVTRAKMFYDTSRRSPGFIIGNDFVVIDEVKLVQFGDVNEMRSIMQGFMEYGTFNIGGYDGKSDAGVVFLGNIHQDNMDEYTNMFTELPKLFQESALLDRIHGFIKGWDIPRMNDDLKVCGWALNSEYFSSIMHQLRDDIGYRAIVDALVEMPDSADTRDTEAVKRICTAYLKLLFPNVRSPKDISMHNFNLYCLRPACKMRGIIKTQLGILDVEYKGKGVPQFAVRDLSDED